MKWATGRPPGSGWQGCSLRRELEVAPKREQAGETSRRIRNSFELGKECRGCAPGRVTSKTNFHAPVIANCDCVLVPGVRRASCTTCELREQRTTNYTKLPVTPWNPWAACFGTQLMTLASL